LPAGLRPAAKQVVVGDVHGLERFRPSSGFAGSVGQIPVCGVVGLPEVRAVVPGEARPAAA
jgi:hypothetical protein